MTVYTDPEGLIFEGRPFISTGSYDETFVRTRDLQNGEEELIIFSTISDGTLYEAHKFEGIEEGKHYKSHLKCELKGAVVEALGTVEKDGIFDYVLVLHNGIKKNVAAWCLITEPVSKPEPEPKYLDMSDGISVIGTRGVYIAYGNAHDGFKNKELVVPKDYDLEVVEGTTPYTMGCTVIRFRKK